MGKQNIHILLLLWVLGIFFPSASQNLQFIPLNVDYARFRGTENKVYVEVYLSFYQRNLRYIQTDSGYVARFNTRAAVFQNDSLVEQKSRAFHNVMPVLKDIKSNRQFIDFFLFELNPGEYSVKVTVDDQNSHGIGEYVVDISLKPFPTNSMAISDIELCSEIKRAERKSLFDKNTLRVVPNPATLYGIALPALFYYAELYNVPYSKDSPSTYTVEAQITDVEGNVVRELPSRSDVKPASSFVVVGGQNVITLQPGTYFFHLKVTDNGSGQSISAKKRFIFYKPQRESALASNKGATDFLGQFYRNLDEEQLDEEFSAAAYIATAEEKKTFKALGLEGKRRFLSEFWNRRDVDKNTPQNEYRQEYLMLVQYANQKFSTIRTEGWKTDRGRILLTYGRPDEIDRHPMQTDTKPFEIWNYFSLEGGVIFVFADLTNFGDYQLIHSTHSKELHDPNWMRLIQRTPTGNAPELQNLSPPDFQ